MTACFILVSKRRQGRGVSCLIPERLSRLEQGERIGKAVRYLDNTGVDFHGIGLAPYAIPP